MFTVRIAEHSFTIDNRYPFVAELCREYLCSEDGTETYISVSDAEIQSEALEDPKKSEVSEPPKAPEVSEALEDPKKSEVSKAPKVPEASKAYLESLAVQRKIAEALIQSDVLLFHGSAVAVDGKAYLFTAPSGTGKSTHAKLWMQVFGSRAVMVDDDKPFLHISDTQAVVYGTPWNGKHRRGNNISVPLKAICVLERGTVNEIEPLGRKDSWRFLLQQSYHSENMENMSKILYLLDRLSSCVELYRLKCNMEPEAAQKAFDGMNGY